MVAILSEPEQQVTYRRAALGADLTSIWQKGGISFHAALLVPLLCLLPAGCGGPRRPANVVILSIDTLNRGSLRAFAADAPPHPNLDRFAARARRFRWGLSTSGWTLPAQASLLSGLYPDRHGANRPHGRIRPQAVTLAERLHRRGFETVGFTDAGFLLPVFGFPDGFDRYDGVVRPGWRSGLALPRGGEPEALGSRGAVPFDRALAYLDARRPGDPPFFLFLQTYSVHDYFCFHYWAIEKLRFCAPEGEGEFWRRYLQCLVGNQQCTPAEWELLQKLYRVEVEHVDAGVGKVLQALDRKGLRDSTLVVFTADHGEGFDPARARTHHGGRLHADLVRVPLLIAGPGVEPGETDQRTSLVDVMPTVLQALGVPAPGGLDGRSVVPWLKGGKAVEPRSLYAMDFYMWWQRGRRREDGTPRTKPLVQAVVRGGMWYVRSPTGEELYADDDAEQRENLVGKSPRLGALQELASARRPVAPVERTAGSPEVERELRALGYIR